MDDIVVDVFIEIAKNSHIKYEYDKEKRALICDRILHTPLKYHFNYGFIPNTLSEDGDPIDAIVLMDDALVPGCYIKCHILGYLQTEDSAGNDPKLICCPISKVDPLWNNIDDIDQISEHELEKIKYFFQHYKDLEYKQVIVGDFKSKEDAINCYISSVQRFSFV
jgi:inorganic pyrophosphatase